MKCGYPECKEEAIIGTYCEIHNALIKIGEVKNGKI